MILIPKYAYLLCFLVSKILDHQLLAYPRLRWNGVGPKLFNISLSLGLINPLLKLGAKSGYNAAKP